MSVYKPKGSEVYVYDFQWRGRRFSGSTGQSEKRKAEQIEREVREAEKAAPGPKAPARSMTISEAATRYWAEAGQHMKRSDQFQWSADYLIKFFGPEKMLKEICDDDVSALIATRRLETVDNVLARRESARPRKMPVAKKPPRRVSAATVNRSVLEPLKRIMLRARDSWGKEIGRVDWRKRRMAEPKERDRSLSAEEETALFQSLPASFHPIVRFAIRTGCRASECTNLRWTDVDWGNRRISILGKGGKLAPIPMEARVRDLLWSLQEPKTEFVFRLHDGRQITYAYLYSAFIRATKKAGITNLRVHDLRHTAATRLVQKTGNLKMAMKLLRHENISTTAKYASVIDDDLRNALDAMGEQEVPRKVPYEDDKSLKEIK